MEFGPFCFYIVSVWSTKRLKIFWAKILIYNRAIKILLLLFKQEKCVPLITIKKMFSNWLKLLFWVSSLSSWTMVKAKSIQEELISIDRSFKYSGLPGSAGHLLIFRKMFIMKSGKWNSRSESEKEIKKQEERKKKLEREKARERERESTNNEHF